MFLLFKKNCWKKLNILIKKLWFFCYCTEMQVKIIYSRTSILRNSGDQKNYVTSKSGLFFGISRQTLFKMMEKHKFYNHLRKNWSSVVWSDFLAGINRVIDFWTRLLIEKVLKLVAHFDKFCIFHICFNVFA
jgi:hypothetical protein